MTVSFRRSTHLAMAVLALTALAAGPALAGTGGTEFDSAYTLLTDWLSGTLGRTIAIAMALVGLGAAIITRSFMPLVGAVTVGLVAVTLPNVIEGIVTASLITDGQALTLPAVEAFLNGA